MEPLKVLIVDDDEAELITCKTTAKRYQKEKTREIDLVESKGLADALEKLNGSFDGAIIDLKLEKEGYEGNEIVETINKLFRIPVVILTGTPLNVYEGIGGLQVFKKGEIQYDVIFDYFFQVYETGLTKILGGRGHIERTMQTVFWNNIYPVLGDWISHVSNGKSTEKSLLRFIVNHLLELLDGDLETCFPEEMYISPPISINIKTGSIVQAKDSSDFYIVLSPACDLVVYEGGIKTDSILLCLIENSVIKNAQKDWKIKTPEEDKERADKKLKRADRILSQVPSNNYSHYYHYLPKTSRFEGGVINFRKVSTFSPSVFKNKFKSPLVQVSSAFTKDIVARFSSYYARQGQPDFDFNSLVEELKKT